MSLSSNTELDPTETIFEVEIRGVLRNRIVFGAVSYRRLISLSVYNRQRHPTSNIQQEVLLADQNVFQRFQLRRRERLFVSTM